MGKKIFTNPDVLEESPFIDNLPILKDEVNKISTRIKGWTSTNENNAKIISYVGPYGAGKSVVLHQVRNKLNENETYHWVNIDVWSYADRETIWDGFVIEVLSIIEGVNREKIAGTIDEPLDAPVWAHKLRHIFATDGKQFVGVLVIWYTATTWLWLVLRGSEFALWAEAMIIFASPILLVSLGLVGIATFVRHKAPINRAFQFENKLRASLSSINKPLVVVVEDVDRTSQNEGVVFLETLKSFLNNYSHDFSNSIIVIAPQDRRYFQHISDPQLSNQALKVYDNTIYFTSNLWDDNGIDKLLSLLGPRKDVKDELKMVCEEIISGKKDEITPRILKFALRETYDLCNDSDLYAPLVVALILSRYTTVHAPFTKGPQSGSEIIRKNSRNATKSARMIYKSLYKLASGSNTHNDYTLTFVDPKDLSPNREGVPIEFVENKHPNGSVTVEFKLPSTYEFLLQ